MLSFVPSVVVYSPSPLQLVPVTRIIKTGRTGRGLDKKRSKKSREAGRREMSDGHSDVGAGEEHDIDFGDMTDDGEVELNLPREDTMERNPPGEDVRDLPGATASGASVTNQEERYRLEPRSPGVGATVGVDGPRMNGGGMRVPAPALPPLWQDRQSAGVAMPTRMDADRHGGFRAPEAQLLGKGTRLASHVFAEAQDKDVNSDRRDLPWSPENVLVDTVARRI